MSKKYGMWSFSSSPRVALDRCKRAASRNLSRTRGVTFPTADDHSDEQSEVGSLTKVRHRLQVDLAGDRMEFDQFLQNLCIGDRVRVLCDDGVLVAEKISQTQFELIHSETISQFIH